MTTTTAASTTTVPVRLLLDYGCRIRVAMENGDITDLREIASDIQHERVQLMSKFVGSTSAKRRALYKSEYHRLAALVTPVLAAIA